MSEFSNGLTSAQLKRLALLSEEMGEAQQVIGKIMRHGYESYNPTIPATVNRLTNRRELEREIGDIAAAVKLLVGAEDLNFDAMENHAIKKVESVKRWLHHQDKA